MITCRETRPRDIRHIAAGMHPMDALECSLFGHTPTQALTRSSRISDMAMTFLVNGRPEAMLGVAPVSLIDGIGSPWLLGTVEARRHGRAFLAAGRALVPIMQDLHPKLFNFVHEDNAASIRWLKRLGFDFCGEVAYVGGHRMLRFSRGF